MRLHQCLVPTLFTKKARLFLESRIYLSKIQNSLDFYQSLVLPPRADDVTFSIPETLIEVYDGSCVESICIMVWHWILSQALLKYILGANFNLFSV